MKPGVEAVCFDLGGVLARIHHTWEEAAQAAGVPLPPGTQFGGHSQFPLFDDYQAGRCPSDLYHQGLAEYLGVSREEAERVHMGILAGPNPGTEALVDRVSASGVLTGLLSNTNPEHWDQFLSGPEYPSIQRLQVRLGSQQAGCVKPDPIIFRLWSDRAEVEPSRVLFFDDTMANVESARELGWLAVWVDHTLPVAPQIDSALREHGL